MLRRPAMLLCPARLTLRIGHATSLAEVGFCHKMRVSGLVVLLLGDVRVFQPQIRQPRCFAGRFAQSSGLGRALAGHTP
jgi:hypothetical protein